MRAQARFNLTRQATLALLVSAAFSGPAGAAPVARVDFAFGGVSATGTDGKQRPLAKGAVLESGETVTTNASGRAHLRFTDGGYTSVQPDTQFRIDDYRFEGTADGEEKGFFSLLKGGLRTITGVIGRHNKSTYRVNTATATIGIRGTEYLAKVTNSLELSVGAGTAEVRTREDTPRTFLVPEFSSMLLSAPTSPVVFTQTPVFLPPAPAEVPAVQASQPAAAPGQTDSQQTVSPTPPPPPPVFVAGGQTTSSGTASVISGGGGGFSLSSGSGYALAFSIGGEGGFCNIGCAAGNTATCGQPIVTLTSTGGLTWTQGTAFITSMFAGVLGFPNDGFVTTGLMVIEPGTLQFSGGSIGGVLGWGVFSNGQTSPESKFWLLGENEGAHGILFIPTPSMPTSGSATYTMIPGGATRPTFTNNMGGGELVPGLAVTGATMTANFATSMLTGQANFSVPSGSTYALTFSNVSINGAGFGGESPPSFNGTFSRTSVPSGTPPPTPCLTSCEAHVNGGFAGTANPSPPFAGYAYRVAVPSGGFGINGAIASQGN